MKEKSIEAVASPRLVAKKTASVSSDQSLDHMPILDGEGEGRITGCCDSDSFGITFRLAIPCAPEVADRTHPYIFGFRRVRADFENGYDLNTPFAFLKVTQS